MFPGALESTNRISNGVSNSAYSASHPLPIGGGATSAALMQLPQPTMVALSSILTLGPYRNRKDLSRHLVLSKYSVIGYIAAGTYGKVYKAKLKAGKTENGGDTDMKDEEAHVDEEETGTTPFFAIKKFKSDNHLSMKLAMNAGNPHDFNGYTGISQSAMREMSLCRELNHKNITKLMEIILENKSIYMVFEFFEHDLLQIIHHHTHLDTKQIPDATVKSLIWQVLNGVTFLHKNWVFHRDLKPANIMVSSDGVVKIGDLGLARKFNNPLQSLYTGDKVVVTIWYRAPELLLGARHYTPAIDLWAVGCILAELLLLRPIFKGEEAKIDLANKKLIPFQKNQLQKIFEIMGTPSAEAWPTLPKYPDYYAFQQHFLHSGTTYQPNLANWYKMIGGKNPQCLGLLRDLLQYDPTVRIQAEDALLHPFFLEAPPVRENAFEGLNVKYPKRRIYTDDIDIVTQGNVGVKRHWDDQTARKRQR